MKKEFKFLMMVLLGLFAGAGTVWGQISLGDIDLDNPATWFYVNLEAKVSTPACGSNPGQVKLNYTNTQRQQYNPWITDTKPVNPYKDAAEIEEDLKEKWQNAFYAGDGAAASSEEKPDYPTTEESEGWTEAQITAAATGFTTGWDWAKAGHDYSNYPQNPYTRQADLKSRWDDGYNEGLNAAENGQEKQTPDVSGLDSDQAQALIAGYNAAYDWYVAGRYLNVVTGASIDEYQTAWGASANLNGCALFHMEGVDSVMNMISSYAYFEAKVQENDGWYFTGWSFTEGESDLGGAVDTDTPSDKGKLFKIFPADDPGWDNKSQEYVYATFKPVMVANYTVNGTIDVTPGVGNSNSNTVVFDVQGERVDANDFTASVASAATDGYTGHGSCTANAALVNGQIVVTVTYTASDAASGIYRANVTLASKSGSSSLTAPMYIRVSAAAGGEAALYDGKADPANYVTSGTLAAMIDAATAEQTVALNANYAGAVSINKDVTFDLNGYTLSNNLVVTGGNVTLAFSKFGGKITNTVVVQNGATLTLNGGTIVVENGKAVDVKSGGALIQNGATIRSTASASNTALGIVIAGTVTFNDGSVEAQAISNNATAVQIVSTGKLIANGGVMRAATNGNAYAVDVTATAGEAQINGGTFNAVSTANKAVGLATSGKMTIGKYAVVYAHTDNTTTTASAVNVLGSAEVTIDGGRFSATHIEDEMEVSHAPINAEGYTAFTFNAGYIKTDKVYLNEGITEPKLYNITYKGKDYMDGYRYLAVREDLNAKDYGMQAARIGTTGYTNVTDAIAYANNNTGSDVVIILQNDDEIPAGYYTLPSRATLIIPMKNEQETGNTIIPRVVSTGGSNPYVQPTAYVTLTVAPGANIDVHGTIEVTGTQRSSDQSYASLPNGPCGFINMQEGSSMTMQSGSELRAWGFIIGKGETDVRRNATVREQFQMGDWKGGSTSFGMLSDNRRVFPLTHYYIQNIESPFKYHPGAILSTTTSVSATFGGIAVTAAANDIKVVGVSGRDQAMFLMDNEADADNTWVRKWYDVENDLQVYDVNNSAHIGSMVLDLGKLGNTPLVMNSGYFVLPITCNMKIHLLTGLMDFTQNTALLPGAEVEIDKEATVTIVHNIDGSVLSGALYIYDADQWDKYAYDEAANGGIKYTKPVMYSAGFGGQPTARADQFYDQEKLKDASINVHGSFAINQAGCYLYTSEGGANIFSSNEDAGTYVFNVAGPTGSTQEQVWQVKNRSNYNDGDAFTAAQLKNKEGHEPAFTQTTNYEANASLCYMDDEWRYRMFFDCYSADVDMDVYAAEAVKKAQKDLYGMPIDYDLGKAVEHIYIKPQEWVEIVGKATIEFNWSETPDPEHDPYHPYLVGVEGNADHTYSDAAGAGRLFIMTLTDQYDCDQWWEVEKKDNLYHCIHPLNDTYYYWGEDENGMERWMEKKFTITWKNWNGDIIQTTNKDGYQVNSYEVTYGTVAEFLGTNPTRESNIDYTYDFTGWTPALGPVTSDVTYTATFTQKPRMYTIIFQQEGGVEIERHFLTHNEMPVCENTPTKPGHTLEWTPAIKAVTGDQTYVATWHEDPPTEYEVTFYDYDGTSVLQQGNVAVGAMPEYTEATPNGKPASASGEYTYVFDHWAPDLEVVTATSVKSYTAIYREVPVLYTVKFVKENGDPNVPEDVIESHQYQYGETPICSNLPTKDPTAQYTYALRWTPQIQTVMDDAVYTAVFDATINKYTVSLKCSPSGAATLSGAGIYEYNAAANAVEVTVANITDGYEFDGWADLDAGDTNKKAITRQMAIIGDINLVAEFHCATCDNVTITWNNYDGSLLKSVSQAKGTATTYTGSTPTHPATTQYTYTFDGWSTSQGGDLVYKNGMTPVAAEGGATYYAHFAATPIPNLVAPANGAPVVITESATYRDLVLSSDGLQSSQLVGADLLTIIGDAYFDLTLNADPATWYAIAVPWQVNISDGISVNGVRQRINSDFYLLIYNSEERAAHGPSSACWTFLSSGVMQPGTLYMIYMVNGAATIRFTKKDGAPILTDKLNVYAHASGTGSDTDAGWNGIANPALYYAYLNASSDTYSKANFGQKYIPGDDRYEAIDMKNNKLIVGQPVFVQVAANKSNVEAETGNGGFSAPVRRAKVDNAYYEIQISNGERYSDRLYLQTMEDKEDRYTIGLDLAKAGTSTKVAQMWVVRYDTKLCVNTTAPKGTSATYPLGIQVPADGEYQIYSTTEMQDNQEMYVTFNGRAIWNLAYGPYEVSLTQGTHTEYGLKLVQSPAVVTGVEQTTVEDQSVRKVLIDNTIYIIREGAVYTINGHKVK